MSRIWLEIKNCKDPNELTDIIFSLEKDDIYEIIDLLPELLKSKFPIVRAELFDIIGTYKLTQLLPDVLKSLEVEKNPIATSAVSII